MLNDYLSRQTAEPPTPADALDSPQLSRLRRQRRRLYRRDRKDHTSTTRRVALLTRQFCAIPDSISRTRRISTVRNLKLLRFCSHVYAKGKNLLKNSCARLEVFVCKSDCKFRAHLCWIFEVFFVTTNWDVRWISVTKGWETCWQYFFFIWENNDWKNKN